MRCLVWMNGGGDLGKTRGACAAASRLEPGDERLRPTPSSVRVDPGGRLNPNLFLANLLFNGIYFSFRVAALGRGWREGGKAW